MPTLSRTGVEVRDAGRSDLPAVRRVLLGAYLFGGVEIRWKCDPKLIKQDEETPAEAVLQQLSAARVEMLAKQLQGEPSGLVASLLRAGTWSWHGALLQALEPLQRRRVEAEHVDPAVGQPEHHPQHRPEQRGLPYPVPSHQRSDPSRPGGKRGALQHFHLRRFVYDQYIGRTIEFVGLQVVADRHHSL